MPRPPPQPGWSSSREYRAAHTTSSGMPSASRTSSSTSSSIGVCAACRSSSTTTTGPRLANPRRRARRPGADLGDAVALLVPGLAADAERDAQPLDDLPRLVGRGAFEDELLEPRPERLRRRVRRLPHLVQQDLREGSEHHVLLEGAGPALQDPRLLGQPRDELVGDAALADPRLPEQRHQVAAARLARAVERVLQQPQLALAVHEWDRLAPRAGLRGRRPATRAPRPRTPSPRPRASARTGPATARGDSSSRRRARSRGRRPAAAAPPCSPWRRRAGPAMTPRSRSRRDPCGCPRGPGAGPAARSPVRDDRPVRRAGARRAPRGARRRRACAAGRTPRRRRPRRSCRRGRGATRAPRRPCGSSGSGPRGSARDRSGSRSGSTPPGRRRSP